MVMRSKSQPPIEVSAPAAQVQARFDTSRHELSDATARRLRDACASVATDPVALVEASRDWWPIGLRWARAGMVPALPHAVVRPSSAAEVADVLRICNDDLVPVTAAGGRSGVCGGAVPVRGGIALDVRALSGIVSVDDASCLVEVRAGTVGIDLEETLRGEHALTVGHWPQSIELSTVGGWIACRAAGQYSTRYGKIEDIVAGVEVVLAGGRVVRTGSLAGAGPRAATGPDLTQLFVGSEGTLGVLTSALLRVHPQPRIDRRDAWTFRTFDDGLNAVRRTLRRGATPAVVRLYDAEESRRNFNHDAGNLLVALDEGDDRIVDAAMTVLTEECEAGERLDRRFVDHWYETRNDVSALANVVNMGVVVDTIEVAAPWRTLLSVYEEATDRLRAIEGTIVASAHQSHAYIDGACLYFTFAGMGPDPTDDAWAEAYYRSAWDAVMRATRNHGGSISHHHGIGLVRGAYVAEALGEGYAVLRSLKTALDPNGILNPGKLGLGGAESGW
ncbi:MAG: FAD-binding oxidoreductase [Chloroflexi bacterium]|nr:MAG: FAD-binding oxidoreductase [Chloroflexota bacterium]